MSLVLSGRICARCLSTSVRDLKRKALLAKIIRVDHAGEFGAHRIYEGQLAVLGRTSVGPLLKVRYMHICKLCFPNEERIVCLNGC